MAGSLIISLDFELHWGGAEVWDIKEKASCFINTRKVIMEMLQLFQDFNIKVTWATVGFLFAETRDEAVSFFPPRQPSYLNQSLNYYRLFEDSAVGSNEEEDPFHFGYSLIEEIKKTPGQELASHTFSHYYCNESGQTKEEFQMDLAATQKIADNIFNTNLTSLVFPRNQYNKEYLESLRVNNFKVIRTNPDVWFWKKNYVFTPLARALDTLLPISSRLSYPDSKILTKENIVLLPASRFFRPYCHKEKFVQKLKVNRIKNEMFLAAKHGENYHLWWHPHNFGYFPQENMSQLKDILEFYLILKKDFSFNSKNMGDFKI
jgi:peptidoglycan/xylan/chitin deacetylase (PgdA/CDA1 family)